MKRFILASAVMGLVIVASSFALEHGQLELIVRSDQTSYILGELLQFEFEIKNNSQKEIVIVNGLRHLDGYLSVWISKDGRIFEKYDHRKWGTGDSMRITTLKPNESTINKAWVFYNSKPRFSDSVTPEIAQRESAGRILTDYAFPESGVYLLKASYSIYLAGESEAVRIESSPVTINITEPTGDDLRAWNKIKDKGDIAYFMQEGDFLIPSYKSEERAKLQVEIEGILAEHPNSIYAGPLRQSLEKYTANEEKRKAFQRQMKQRQKPEPKK